MNDQKIIIESLAMDLKRVALGLYRGSSVTAAKFKQEALKREQELKEHKPNNYLRLLLSRTRKALKENHQAAAEEVLMYSVLFQNFAQKNFNK